MPRRPPGRLRNAAKQQSSSTIPGVSRATSYALDRLSRPEVSSEQVEQALEDWQRTASLSRARLAQPCNDWLLYIGPSARNQLEYALRALSRRQGAALRALVERTDEILCAKTFNNPLADPTQPWWGRRWQP
jgi:hypothetical protein